MNIHQIRHAHRKILEGLLIGWPLELAIENAKISTDEYRTYFSANQKEIHRSVKRKVEFEYSEPIDLTEAKPTTIDFETDSPEKAVHLLSERHRQYRDYFETKNIRSK
jgi:hypothetical protein